VFNWKCHGKRVRQICIFGIGDLPLLASRQEMFANKFHLDYQPYTYQCMDELIFNRTRDEYFNQLKFNTSQYQSLEFIKKIQFSMTMSLCLMTRLLCMYFVVFHQRFWSSIVGVPLLFIMISIKCSIEDFGGL